MKILWCQRHEGWGDRLATSLNCKDYLIYRLTGAIGTDYSDASGTGAFDLGTFTWSAEILEAAGVAPSVMPPLHASTDLAGTITPQAARDTGLLPGTPVYCGCGDGTAASVGTGVRQPGQGYISLGTSAWISYADDAPLLDPRQRTFNLAGIQKGQVFPIGTMQAAGSSYNWMRDQLCQLEKQAATAQGGSVYDRINRQIAAEAPGAGGVLFLPYLTGERSPWWDANAKGAFLGLTISTTHAQLLRAVMEGVAMNLGLILRVFREKYPFSALRIIGGGAQEAAVAAGAGRRAECPGGEAQPAGGGLLPGGGPWRQASAPGCSRTPAPSTASSGGGRDRTGPRARRPLRRSHRPTGAGLSPPAGLCVIAEGKISGPSQNRKILRRVFFCLGRLK